MTRAEARPLKVWGGNADAKSTQNPNRSRQTRCLIAARTLKRAQELGREALRITPSEMRMYWSQTGNREELALAVEEGVWVNEGEGCATNYRRAL